MIASPFASAFMASKFSTNTFYDLLKRNVPIDQAVVHFVEAAAEHGTMLDCNCERRKLSVR
jgi:hypothetical protein